MLIEEVSGGVILFRKKNGRREYLILEYTQGHWDFPKGHVEKGEDTFAAAMRECREETGIKATELTLINGFRENIDYTYKRSKMPQNTYHKRVEFYLAESGTDKVKISQEHKCYQWLQYPQALEKVTYQNAKNIIKKAEDKLVQSTASGLGS